MSASLVGSEMCIRDRVDQEDLAAARGGGLTELSWGFPGPGDRSEQSRLCLLYTSDAADDM
eukprot:10564797-Alexandrium_andersonii.AAC.1